MEDCVIAGVGMTPFGKFMESTVRTLAQDATRIAIDDSGIEARDIQHVYFANAAAGLITGQEMIRGQAALRGMPFMGVPITNIENACASGSTALFHAWQAIRSGQIEVALVVGAEKLTHLDKAVSFGAYAKAVDLEEELPPTVGSGSGSIFMDIYAAKTRKYMQETGATQQDFARIVVKSRIAGALNPLAQFRKPTSIEEVVSARVISTPLTLPMCSSIGDGAAAIVLLSARRATAFGMARPVRVAAVHMVSGLADPALPNCATRSSRGAYELAGIGPKDIHVVELHDASAPAELIHYENLGLCGPGEAVELLRSGATDVGGRLSVNPSGGLLSRGHPIGATGVAQIHELTLQLRGQAGERQRPNARVAIAENNGGQMGTDAAVGVTTILHI